MALSQNVLQLDDTNFDREVLASSVPVLVDFWAAWCAPCRAIAPHVDAIADEREGKLRVGKVDVDASPDVASRYDVRSMPTLLMFRGGEVIGQLVGAVPRARIEAFVAGALARAA